MSVVVEPTPKPRPATGRNTDVPPQVFAFCDREGLFHELRTARDLLRRHFAHVPAKLSVIADPDSGEEWVSIHIRYEGDTDDFLNRYRRYKRDWLAATEWPKRHLVRLSYGIT